VGHSCDGRWPLVLRGNLDGVSDPRVPTPSPEVVAVLRRILSAMRDRDTEALANLFSRSSWFRAIGSDADEFWDAETFLPVARIQLEEMPSHDMSVPYVEAYELGDVAWGVAIIDAVFENGVKLRMRFTAVFLIEDGVWRCVQVHNSVPIANEEALGVTLTTTLTNLLNSLDADTLAPMDASEGTVSLMFTDIEDSTVLAQEMGDRKWRRIIEDHDRFIAATVRKHAGTVIKTLGDGALITFGGARAALRCAVDLQAGFAERPFAVRIGIHAGDVVRSGDDVIGVTVNKAARVAAAAAGGQVVVSSIVRELVGATDEFSFGDPFLVELKGIEGVHELIPLELGSARLHPAATPAG
jgi:adenylate cyclase